ncbi:hypothetical protein [Flavilitoribacter nigricans]|uniref:Uncharacterized protein n=1 Tax=Flavilitoribacter nigricans (strain ATCC 23147 / DSM 23189 / NBRC 102662 / NCIMB 1420 / SS-2) TaxID=1122177 RepID=A0A2D0ND94_FLAN2|nr:hypothetical protein [Flavilitoribacter nigricans]PHN06149.1 hypothetical protein CRP01_11230 [Flavilitoribacter nigricans DSM 23189 = NBRC 102662]
MKDKKLEDLLRSWEDRQERPEPRRLLAQLGQIALILLLILLVAWVYERIDEIEDGLKTRERPIERIS